MEKQITQGRSYEAWVGTGNSTANFAIVSVIKTTLQTITPRCRFTVQKIKSSLLTAAKKRRSGGESFATLCRFGRFGNGTPDLPHR